MEDTTIEDVLKTVQNYYAQKDYLSALDVLTKNQNEIPEGIWHSNLGTIHASLENWPLARFHFLMADNKGFSTKETVQNRELVEEKLEVSRIENPTSTTDYFFKYSLAATHGIFTTIGLLLIIAGILAIWKKVTTKVSVIFFLASALVFGFNWWIISLDKSVALKSQSIFEGPSAIFDAANELSPGVLVITSEHGEWLKIIYPSRFQGWIKKSGLKELK